MNKILKSLENYGIAWCIDCLHIWANLINLHFAPQPQNDRSDERPGTEVFTLLGFEPCSDGPLVKNAAPPKGPRRSPTTKRLVKGLFFGASVCYVFACHHDLLLFAAGTISMSAMARTVFQTHRHRAKFHDSLDTRQGSPSEPWNCRRARLCPPLWLKIDSPACKPEIFHPQFSHSNPDKVQNS